MCDGDIYVEVAIGSGRAGSGRAGSGFGSARYLLTGSRVGSGPAGSSLGSTGVAFCQVKG